MAKRIISIKIKSRPYKDSLNREFGLLATKVAKYGIYNSNHGCHLSFNIKNLFFNI